MIWQLLIMLANFMAFQKKKEFNFQKGFIEMYDNIPDFGQKIKCMI